MQVVLPRCRSVSILKKSIIQSTTTTTTTTTTVSSFHSTPISLEKWKNKWNHDVRSGQEPSKDVKRGQQPSKNYIRYETRQKRADAKKALKDLLFKSGSSKSIFQDYFPKMDGTTSRNTEHADHSDISDKRSRSNSSTRRASQAQHKRMKRKFKPDSFSDDFDEHPETNFQAKFGSRWYTWSFKSWEESYFRNTTNGFEWREHSNRTTSRKREWINESDLESDDESCSIGSSSDRTILGLPSRGPLKIEDVKNAFRLSALKWHPDKHQGPSQAMAEEKFKLCVNAYKSLCSTLTPA